jgi:peptidyl-prolyl cis-trans isomerase SurA
MKRFLMLGGCLAVLCGSVSQGQGVVDRIVAIVNQEVITLSEVDKVIAPLRGEIQIENRLERDEKVRELRLKALDRLVEEKVLDYEAKKTGIKVTSKEVDVVIQDIKRRSNVTQEDLVNALTREGLTYEQYKKEIEKQIARQRLVQWSVKVEPKVDEKVLRAFYETHSAQYLTLESYHPAHILFAVPKNATPEQVLEIRMRCQKVLDRIKNGENFGEMALLYSQDPSSREGGDLGVFKKGELLPPLEKAALALKVGQVSGVVRTEFGFHIIKLIDRKGGYPLPFEDVKEKIEADYMGTEFDKAMRQFISSVKQKSVIEIKM